MYLNQSEEVDEVMWGVDLSWGRGSVIKFDVVQRGVLYYCTALSFTGYELFMHLIIA